MNKLIPTFRQYEQWRLPIKKRTVPWYIMQMANELTPDSTPEATPESTPESTPNNTQTSDSTSHASSSSTSPPRTGTRDNLRSHRRRTPCPCHGEPCTEAEPKKRKRSVGQQPASTANKKKKTGKKPSK